MLVYEMLIKDVLEFCLFIYCKHTNGLAMFHSKSICVLAHCNDQCNTPNGLAMFFRGTAA